MPLPAPEVGLVVSYGYLWRHEYEKGQEEGRKIRPCVIVLAVKTEENGTQVTVAPVTHTSPKNPATAVEIPLRVKQYLGLDNARSWVMVDEVNQFIWPGFDLRPIPNRTEEYAYGFLPPVLFREIKEKLLAPNVTRKNITLRD